MTNKERLEEVISRWNRERDDYDWLVEQARQVEYLSRIIDSQNQSLAELMVENKCYREALEEIARGRFPGASYKARKALEGEDYDE